MSDLDRIQDWLAKAAAAVDDRVRRRPATSGPTSASPRLNSAARWTLYVGSSMWNEPAADGSC